MKRYYIDYRDCCTYECADGDFVKFEDVGQQLKEKDALIVELQTMVCMSSTHLEDIKELDKCPMCGIGK